MKEVYLQAFCEEEMIAKGKYRAIPMVIDSPTVHMKPTVALRFCTPEFLKSNPAPAKNGIV